MVSPISDHEHYKHMWEKVVQGKMTFLASTVNSDSQHCENKVANPSGQFKLGDAIPVFGICCHYLAVLARVNTFYTSFAGCTCDLDTDDSKSCLSLKTNIPGLFIL